MSISKIIFLKIAIDMKKKSLSSLTLQQCNPQVRRNLVVELVSILKLTFVCCSLCPTKFSQNEVLKCSNHLILIWTSGLPIQLIHSSNHHDYRSSIGCHSRNFGYFLKRSASMDLQIASDAIRKHTFGQGTPQKNEQ